MGTVTNFVERLVVRKLLVEAIQRGLKVSVNDGEDMVLRQSDNLSDIEDEMFSTDEDYLYFHDPKVINTYMPDAFYLDDEGEQCVQRNSVMDYAGFVHLVYGNGGDDVMSDYSMDSDTTFGDVMEVLRAFTDEIGEGKLPDVVNVRTEHAQAMRKKIKAIREDVRIEQNLTEAVGVYGAAVLSGAKAAD